jgi:serine/threonine-protein kinase
VYLVAPNFVAAGLAVVCSQVIEKLGADVRRAREMGSYRLVELLGTGGMGEVWRARHRMLAREAAIKLVSPKALGKKDKVDTDGLVRRFEREARATAMLTSPHTIHIYDFGRTADGTLFYAMELLAGMDLETMVRDHGPVLPERAIHFLRQICESLAEAHESGLVHRDVKPANLFACRVGREHDFIKVLDFGIVALRAPDDSHSTRLTESERTKLEIPAGLDRLILDCLAKDPAKRPASAAAVADRLDAIPLADRWNRARAAEWWLSHEPCAPVAEESRHRSGNTIAKA